MLVDVFVVGDAAESFEESAGYEGIIVVEEDGEAEVEAGRGGDLGELVPRDAAFVDGLVGVDGDGELGGVDESGVVGEAVDLGADGGEGEAEFSAGGFDVAGETELDTIVHPDSAALVALVVELVGDDGGEVEVVVVPLAIADAAEVVG